MTVAARRAGQAQPCHRLRTGKAKPFPGVSTFRRSRLEYGAREVLDPAGSWWLGRPFVSGSWAMPMGHCASRCWHSRQAAKLALSSGSEAGTLVSQRSWHSRQPAKLALSSASEAGGRVWPRVERVLRNPGYPGRKEEPAKRAKDCLRLTVSVARFAGLFA